MILPSRFSMGLRPRLLTAAEDREGTRGGGGQSCLFLVDDDIDLINEIGERGMSAV